MPWEPLAPLGQLPVGPLDLAEALDALLVAGALGIPEKGRAGVSPLERVLDHAHDVVVRIFGADRAFIGGHGFLLPLSRNRNALRFGRFALGQLELQEPIPMVII